MKLKKTSLLILTSLLFLNFLSAQSWEKTNGPYGCKAKDVEIHPTNKNILYVATNRGLYKTINAGESWTEIKGGIPTDIPIRKIKIDKSNTEILYVLTEDGYYKSTDSGSSWKRVSIAGEYMNHHVIVSDPNNSNILYVGATHPRWDGVNDFFTQDLWKSTDKGENWKLIYADTTNSYFINTITVNPQNSKTIFLGTWASEGNTSGAGVVVSRDGGNTFSTYLKDDPLSGRTVLTFVISPNDTLINYVGTTLNDDLEGPPGMLFKTTDGGQNWTEIMGYEKGGQNSVDCVVIDPNNPNTFFIAGGRLFFRTDDGGSTYTLSSSNFFSTGYTPGNVADLIVDYSGQTPIVYAAGYGMYKSVDSGVTFKLINEGIESESTRSIISDPYNPNRVYSFTYTGYGNLYTHDGGQTWMAPEKPILNNYGMLTALDLNNTDVVYATSTWGLWKSTNAGKNWNWVNNQFQNSHVHGLAVDPFNSNVIYVGVGRDDSNPTGQGLFKTIDGGTTWFNINNGFPNDVHVAEVRIDPTEPNTIYIATRGYQESGSFDMPANIGSGVFKSTDGGASWTQKNNGLTNLSITDLVINPKNPKIIYAAAGAEIVAGEGAQGSVFKSVDGGENWIEIKTGMDIPSEMNLPRHVHGLTINPNNPDEVYAAILHPNVIDKHKGLIFKTSDAGEKWSLFVDGLKRENTDFYEAIEYLTIDPTGNVLYSATNGGVVYKSGTPPDESTQAPVIIAGPAALEATSNSVTIKWHSHEPSTSIVQYGTTTDYGEEINQESLKLHHEVVINNLTPGSTYHFRVGGIDSDNSGPNYSNDFTFNLGNDSQAPIITSVTKIENSEDTGPFEISAKVTDNLGIKSVKLFYKNPGDDNFTETVMEKSSDDIFNSSIPAISSSGYSDYYFEAEDLNGNISKSPKLAPLATYSFETTESGKMKIPLFYFADFDGYGVSRINLNTNEKNRLDYNYGSNATWNGSIFGSQDGQIVIRTNSTSAGVIDAFSGDVNGVAEVTLCNQNDGSTLGRGVISSDNKFAYILKGCDEIYNSIAIVDLNSKTHVGDIEDAVNFEKLTDISISPDNTKLFVVNSQEQRAKMLVVDVATKQTTKVINLEYNAAGIKLSKDKKSFYTLYTGNPPFGKSYLAKIDIAAETVVDTITLGVDKGAGALVLNRKGNAAYIMLGNNSIAVVDLENRTLIENVGFSLQEGHWISDIEMSEDDRFIYLMPNNDQPNVMVFDTRTNKFLDELTIDNNSQEAVLVNVVIDNSAPEAFELLIPTNGDSVSVNNAQFSWEESADADQNDVVTYELHLSNDAVFSAPEIIKDITLTSYSYLGSLQAGKNYWWKVVAVDSKGARRQSSSIFTFTTRNLSSVRESDDIPERYFLAQNFPNPFNPSTTIKFGVKEAGKVVMKLYNIRGQELETIVEDYFEAGTYSTKINMSRYSSGMYIYRLSIGKFQKAKMMVYVK